MVAPVLSGDLSYMRRFSRVSPKTQVLQILVLGGRRLPGLGAQPQPFDHRSDIGHAGGRLVPADIAHLVEHRLRRGDQEIRGGNAGLRTADARSRSPASLPEPVAASLAALLAGRFRALRGDLAVEDAHQRDGGAIDTDVGHHRADVLARSAVTMGAEVHF